MLRLIKPTVSKVAKDLAFIKSLHKASQPNPNCGVRFASIDYFMHPQSIGGTVPKSGVAMFPGTLSEDAWPEAVEECKKYQQELLDKFNFSED